MDLILDTSAFKHKDEGCTGTIMVQFQNGERSSLGSWFFRFQDKGEGPFSFDPPSLEGACLTCPTCGAESPILSR